MKQKMDSGEMFHFYIMNGIHEHDEIARLTKSLVILEYTVLRCLEGRIHSQTKHRFQTQICNYCSDLRLLLTIN